MRQVLQEKEIKTLLIEAGQRQYSIKRLKEKVISLQSEKQYLYSLQSICCDGMPKSNSKKDKTANNAVKLLEIEQIINEMLLKLKKYIVEQNKIELLLSQTLSEEEYRFVKLRYFDKKSFRCISKELFCSRSTCYAIQQRILKKLKTVL